MNRLVIACVLAGAACRGTELAIAPPGSIDEPTGHVAAVAHVDPPPRAPYAAELVPVVARPPVTAVHAGAIRTLAITADGRTVVSVDETGGMRLWPTLDGTREPVVVTARDAAKLAIARDGDDVAIAGLDALGQLELVRVSSAGVEEARVAVDAPRPFVEVAAVGVRFLAVRDDHVIAMIDARGRWIGELRADPGERIGAVAVHGDRALAVLDEDGTVRGRWLALARGLAWGARTPVLPIDASRIALAPDGKRIAARSSVGQGLVIVELARGTIVQTPVPVQQGDPSLAPVGFLDDGSLALVNASQLFVYVEDTLSNVELRAENAVAAGDHAVVGEGAALVLAGSYAAKQYLGYASPALSDLLPVADGFLATEGQGVVHVNAALHVDHRSKLPAPLESKYPTLTLLDDHHVLAALYDGIYVVELDSDRAAVRVFPNGFMGYSRPSRVLALYEQDGYAFARYDPATATFGPVLHVPTEREHGSQAFLLDPLLAGAVAEVIEDDNETRKRDVTQIRATRTGLEIAGSHSVAMAHTAWDIAKADHAIGFGDVHVASPDGSLVAESVEGRLVLRTAQGTVRWTQPARAVAWTPGGRLVASAGGLAYVDLATGALGERQCGWRFGLSAEPIGLVGGVALCEEP